MSLGNKLEKYICRELNEFIDFMDWRTKITLNEFFTSNEHLVIHCDNEEDANYLMLQFHKMGETWCDGEPYPSNSKWDIYEANTCYCNDHTYEQYSWFEKHKGYKIYEFEDIIFEEEKFTEDEKVILRNLKDKYKWIARDSNGDLYVYSQYVEKKSKSWTAERTNLKGLYVFNHLFKNIQWEDEEPCEFRKYL